MFHRVFFTISTQHRSNSLLFTANVTSFYPLHFSISLNTENIKTIVSDNTNNE